MKNKNNLWLGVIIILLIVVGAFILSGKKSADQTNDARDEVIAFDNNKAGDIAGTNTSSSGAQQLSVGPATPTNIVFEKTDEGNVVRWQANGQATTTQYNIYRAELRTNEWKKIGNVAVEGSNRGRYWYINQAIAPGVIYGYAVTAADAAGNESEKSDVVESSAQSVIQ